MEETELLSESIPDNSWRWKTLLMGGVIGALVGLGAAFLLTKRAEQSGQPLKITTGKGVQLGVMITGLLRSILSLGE